ncbi:MAG: hypothetical protein VX854_07375 [Candidatus Thermoplasmatota archaeon]|nr:hypothetical protein [Candidatus Thermoplasmatota archaeon]
MADDVAIQGEGLETLHLKVLRRKWQILALQITATISLLSMYIMMTRTYGACDIIDSTSWCPALDHTLTLSALQQFLVLQPDPLSLPIPNWMTGVGNSGDGRYWMPLFVISILVAGWTILGLQTAKLRRRVNMGILGFALLYLAGLFLITWLIGMIFNFELYLPFGQIDPNKNHVEYLVGPLLFYIQIFILVFYFLPVISGLLGIWGMSKSKISWAIGSTIIYLGLHALLSYEGVRSTIEVNLNALPVQIGDATTWGGLLAPEIAPLLIISLLLMVFLESGFATIRYVEYAFKLPESCKKDPEYVSQFDNILNVHLQQTVGVTFFVGLVTALALKFDDLIVDLVSIFEGSQWSEQVKESLELQLTYGTVISAMIFVIFIAGLRYIIPWPRISGLIEKGIRQIRD